MSANIATSDSYTPGFKKSFLSRFCDFFSFRSIEAKNLKNKRIGQLVEQLNIQIDLLNDYEKALIFADDPAKVMNFELKIEKIKEKIAVINDEIKALSIKPKLSF